VESELGPLDTSATNWPIVPVPRECEDGEFGGLKIDRRTEVLGENLSQRHFIHHKSHFTRPGTPRWKSATNSLSYDAAVT
jgi:hypothetical protein